MERFIPGGEFFDFSFSPRRMPWASGISLSPIKRLWESRKFLSSFRGRPVSAGNSHTKNACQDFLLLQQPLQAMRHR